MHTEILGHFKTILNAKKEIIIKENYLNSTNVESVLELKDTFMFT